MKNSSTNEPIVPNSSSSTSSESQAWAKLLEERSKPKTPAAIKAAGDVKVKMGVLWLVGIVCSVLSVLGCVMFFYDSGVAKDMWVIIGPIITAAMTGTLGYLTGEKNSSK